MPATTLADRAVIRLSGEDVRGFLQGLVTNDVLGSLPVYAGLLTPQGKALFDFVLWADPSTGSGEDVLIDCEADQADALEKRLKIYRLRRPIKIVREPALSIHWALDDAKGVPDPRNPALGYRWIASPDDVAEGWQAHRLSLGIVEGQAEIGTDKTLWLEANAREQNGVSFTKGCYIGQENTARMNYRGKVNRRLAVVPQDMADEKVLRAAYPDLGLAVVVARN